MSFFFVTLTLLVLIAWILYRRRMLEARKEGRLTDDLIRQIEEEGRFEAEEPLDWEEIRDAEERFWEESWDEPDDW